ncbi:hypothetical protein FSP39_010242 [Pinctada imbricata]|uniref:CNNM transmembrane domain-containing protein n=1 Tax=Pinctada imbricata TaxID=66713 RepID=A0AA88Y3Z1_PINIB|nr:hypothetical protein FSP39_010242 [Pinctada imbricata]
MNITCVLDDHNHTVTCGGVTYAVKEETLTYKDEFFWIYLGIYVGLVLFAGLMSGLTMGLLSLDLMTLKIIRDGGTPTEQRRAKTILPLIERHHLLLVTLLLANAGAVEAMPLFLDKISNPIVAVLVSVTAVLIFGEVVPQAVCTRFGLAIGATLSPFVYILIALFFIIAWPLSKVLDCVLGKEHGTFFRRAQLKVLVDLHGASASNLRADSENVHDDDEGPLCVDEVLIIKGALDMKNKTVKDAMLPLDDVYMVNIDDKLDKEKMEELISRSHSRIPVYQGHKSNIVGLLLVKTLITLDPDDAASVRNIIHTYAVPSLLYVRDDTPLFDLLNQFQTGKSHLAFVKNHAECQEVKNSTVNSEDSDVECLLSYQDYSEEIIGIITLEDVIEELIQEEIIDETDVYVDVHKRIQVARARKARMEHRVSGR